MNDDSNIKKKHRKRLAGPKADKEKKKNPHIQDLTAKQRNPKAFAYQSIKKVERVVRRTADVKEKKHHLPVVDRTSVIPPPVIIAIVGPPKVGKTTLIKCLVRNFIKRKITNVCGPITIVSSKKQRLTFIECNNDINSMIDLAKVADLVLLLVDASFGFEMEIFEFLHICKVHGEPKVIGVLTHLDAFANNKKLKKTKKTLKNRFWKDVYPGAKLFYLSGMVNEEYQKTEIHNLGRFISVMKYRPLIWRSTHPYVLCDRMEDITNPEEIRVNEKCDRSISCYGYVRGSHFRNFTSIHLPGVGDFIIKDMNLISDPCPLPSEIKKRSLNERERSIYAPMSGVGGVLYDRDAIYIDIKGSHNLKDTEPRNDSTGKLITNLQKTKTTMDNKISSTRFQFIEDMNDDKSDADSDDDEDDGDDDNQQTKEEKFSSGDEMISKLPWETSMDVDNDSMDDDSASDIQIENRKRRGEVEDCVKNKKIKLDIEISGNESNDSVAIDLSNKWKDNLKQKGILSFLERVSSVANMQKFVYDRVEEGEEDSEGEKEEIVGGLIKVSRSSKVKVEDNREMIRDVQPIQLLRDQQIIEELMMRVGGLFTKGQFDENEDAQILLHKDDELKSRTRKVSSDDDKEHSDNDNDDDDEEVGSDGEGNDTAEQQEDYSKETPKERRERRMKEKLLERKRRLKEMFDAEYDDADGNHGDNNHFESLKEEMNQQGQLNRSVFEDLDEETRAYLEGFRPGLYVRIQVEKMPCEFVKYFDPNYPLIIGGLLSSEQNIGYVTANVKKHRWHKRILKTKDPVILSLGWRRFQTIPVYSIQDHNGRHRQIKYTPAHLHCRATFWGPLTPQGAGIVAIQTTSSATREFRISAMGAVCELDKAFTIVKKLKLIGTPLLIHRNTAFIQGMFNSALEVAKFESASIRTVGGIRGQVKKSIKNGATLIKKSGPLKQAPPPGTFRATFEDKILMSDIVFMRTWCRSEIPQLYNPVATLLQPLANRQIWKGMKTLGELKRERNIKFSPNQDSLYKTIVRKELEPAPLVIPKKLQRLLPYKDKPKVVDAHQPIKRVAVIQEPKERQIGAMIKRMQKLYDVQRKRKRMDMRARAQHHNKQQQIKQLRSKKH